MCDTAFMSVSNHRSGIKGLILGKDQKLLSGKHVPCQPRFCLGIFTGYDEWPRSSGFSGARHCP